MKRIDIQQCLLSDYNGMEPGISDRSIAGTSPSVLEIKQHASKQTRAREEEISKSFNLEIKRCFKLKENENTAYQNVWDTAKQCLENL